jgi:hypothetical protein
VLAYCTDRLRNGRSARATRISLPLLLKNARARVHTAQSGIAPISALVFPSASSYSTECSRSVNPFARVDARFSRSPSQAARLDRSRRCARGAPGGDRIDSGASHRLLDCRAERRRRGRPTPGAGRVTPRPAAAGSRPHDAADSSHPTPHRYAVAVFTRAHRAFDGELASYQLIGSIAATAIARLQR